jgi:hypothetical protein
MPNAGMYNLCSNINGCEICERLSVGWRQFVYPFGATLLFPSSHLDFQSLARKHYYLSRFEMCSSRSHLVYRGVKFQESSSRSSFWLSPMCTPHFSSLREHVNCCTCKSASKTCHRFDRQARAMSTPTFLKKLKNKANEDLINPSFL